MVDLVGAGYGDVVTSSSGGGGWGSISKPHPASLFGSRTC